MVLLIELSVVCVRMQCYKSSNSGVGEKKRGMNAHKVIHFTLSTIFSSTTHCNFIKLHHLISLDSCEMSCFPFGFHGAQYTLADNISTWKQGRIQCILKRPEWYMWLGMLSPGMIVVKMLYSMFLSPMMHCLLLCVSRDEDTVQADILLAFPTWTFGISCWTFKPHPTSRMWGFQEDKRHLSKSTSHSAW